MYGVASVLMGSRGMLVPRSASRTKQGGLGGCLRGQCDGQLTQAAALAHEPARSWRGRGAHRWTACPRRRRC